MCGPLRFIRWPLGGPELHVDNRRTKLNVYISRLYIDNDLIRDQSHHSTVTEQNVWISLVENSSKRWFNLRHWVNWALQQITCCSNSSCFSLVHPPIIPEAPRAECLSQGAGSAGPGPGSGCYLTLAVGSRAGDARHLLGVDHLQALVVRLVVQQAGVSPRVSPLHRTPGDHRAAHMYPPGIQPIICPLTTDDQPLGPTFCPVSTVSNRPVAGLTLAA